MVPAILLYIEPAICSLVNSGSTWATTGYLYMHSARLFLIAAVGLFFSISPALAQDLSRYRNYVLESSFDAVIAASGARPTDAKVLHDRPARIRELDWRAAYTGAFAAQPDPVRQITFTFVDEALYQVVVTYDRDRTDGLTNADVIESLTATYGATVPVPPRSRTTTTDETRYDTIAVARWESAAASLTLFRAAYTPELQLVLVSKPLEARALTAIREAKRLDTLDAPRRAIEQRKKEAADADAAREKTRSTNKGAFRP